MVVTGIGSDPHTARSDLGQASCRSPHGPHDQGPCPGQDSPGVRRTGGVPEGELHPAMKTLLSSPFDLEPNVIKRVGPSYASGVQSSR